VDIEQPHGLAVAIAEVFERQGGDVAPAYGSFDALDLGGLHARQVHDDGDGLRQGARLGEHLGNVVDAVAEEHVNRHHLSAYLFRGGVAGQLVG